MSALQTLRILSRPQVIVGALVFIFGASAFFSLRSRVQPAPALPTPRPAEAVEQAEVTLVVMDRQGLKFSETVQASLPRRQEAQLAAVLALLKERLSGPLALWPEGLSVPEVFWVERADGRRVAVLDFAKDNPQVSVSQERYLLEAIVQTAQRNGAARLSILINGEHSPTFLDHVALSQGLD